MLSRRSVVITWSRDRLVRLVSTMKELFSDANFPRTADGRVYHLGLRPGEVANRILTVGDPGRARRIAKFLDLAPEPFVLSSERGFLTITGTFEGTPLSIVAIGMGIANMDFFVREVRESVIGDMAIIRLGSCGGLVEALPVGSLTVPRACVGITRNYDYDYTASFPGPQVFAGSNPPYRVSRPVAAHGPLHDTLKNTIEALRPATVAEAIVQGDFVNGSADSFYSSQGRQTSFPDHNDNLINWMLETVSDVGTLEMETHHLFHLASVYPSPSDASQALHPVPPTAVTRGAGEITVLKSSPVAERPLSAPEEVAQLKTTGAIYAAAVQIVFAERQSQAFITPGNVAIREEWAGKSCLTALKNFDLKFVHPDADSVWQLQK